MSIRELQAQWIRAAYAALGDAAREIARFVNHNRNPMPGLLSETWIA